MAIYNNIVVSYMDCSISYCFVIFINIQIISIINIFKNLIYVCPKRVFIINMIIINKCFF